MDTLEQVGNQWKMFLETPLDKLPNLNEYNSV